MKGKTRTTAALALVSTAVLLATGLALYFYTRPPVQKENKDEKPGNRKKKRAAKRERKISTAASTRRERKTSTTKRERKISSSASTLTPPAAPSHKRDPQALVQFVLDQVAKETFPTSTEEKESFFMTQVSQGEGLVAKGEAYYDDSVLPFYRALKVYPKPLDLIMLLQKSVPDPVFQIIISVMSLEQKQMQLGFYERFPAKETNVTLAELPSLSSDGSVRRGLVTRGPIGAGHVVYRETPMVCALFPRFEGTRCHFCFLPLDGDGDHSAVVACTSCDVRFCSVGCQRSSWTLEHQFLCTSHYADSRESKLWASMSDEGNKNGHEDLYPHMIARFLASMVAEEAQKSQANGTFISSWDHIDRFRYLETLSTDNTVAEMQLIKDALTNKVPGIDEFLTDDIYLMLKGKFTYNTYPVHDAQGSTTPSSIADSHDNESSTSTLMEEPYRVIPALASQAVIGVGLYKISTYLGQAAAGNANVKMEFSRDTNELTIVALRDLETNEELLMDFIYPG
ncbi:hypothetical protein BC940DRAFT_367850 [Gongronella butleri]|nr:hypothetical protein BC940DRAFT_367850 [Gongronella butleri]